jgi:hypothetical protein
MVASNKNAESLHILLNVKGHRRVDMPYILGVYVYEELAVLYGKARRFCLWALIGIFLKD